MDSTITSLIYDFQDAAVPPPYQRNIHITIDAETITRTDTSNDQITFHLVRPSPAGILSQLSVWIAESHLSAVPTSNATPLWPVHTGAGIHTLIILANHKKVFAASTAKHGESDQLTGDIETFATHLKHCIDETPTIGSTPHAP